MESKLDTEQGDEKQNGAPRKPGTFVKGDPRINRTMGPGHSRKLWGVLEDMRAVYGQDESKDRGPGQKSMRKLFQDNFDVFLRRLGQLEQAFQAASKEEKAAEKNGAVEEVDEGVERSLALCASGLADFYAKRAAEDAEFAAKPDAAALGATLQARLTEALRREELLRREIEELRRQA